MTESWRPPIGGGMTAPGPGPGKKRVPVGSGNDQIRVSPSVCNDERSRPYQESMEPAYVIGKNNTQIRIDVDRDGGVFLDHGELAQLLDAG
ncbi:uncharacterized protein METZ01_LOCUS512171, partial [marine metagenome]